jgi:MtfA peptidase
MFGNTRDRRQQLLARPFPREWLRFFEENISQYGYLPEPRQRKLRDLARVFAAEKQWVGCNGLTVTDEIKLTVAGNACLLLLGIEGDYCFDGVRSILVYPTAYEHPPQMHSDDILHTNRVVYGESWYRGPIVLSWEQVLKRSDHFPPGRNLVLHEFAHHLDGLDGEVNGVPPLASRAQYRRWHEIAEREYNRLRQQARRGQQTLLDEYGATNQVEFFAVATECFFEQPVAMRAECPDLYRILQDCYRQDPALWYSGVPAPEAEPPDASRPAVYAAAVEDSIRAMRLHPQSADAYFSRGVLHLNAREFALAAADLSEAIRLSPEDGEAYQHRGAAYLALERFDEALSDAEQALELDTGDLAAYRVRAEALVGLSHFAEAIDDFDRLLAEESTDAAAWYGRGRAWAGQGEWRSAIADFTRAIRQDPAFAEAYLSRAKAYDALGQDERAQADREEARRRDPALD